MAGQSRIFLSHAGPETEIAEEVADLLEKSGLETILDREKIGQGDSFIAFMEEALSTSDYCLLLWSKVAAERKWVQIEWQSALHRSVKEARAFLAIGRLDAYPLPMLLAPRLYVRLHPELTPGVQKLLKSWKDDRKAEEESDRIVGSAPGIDDDQPDGETVYVTSDLFGITCPWKVDLSKPAGLLLDDVIKKVKLPKSLDHEERVGIRFNYFLGFEETRLERGPSLADQGIRTKSVLWLESEMKMFTPGGEQPALLHRGPDKMQAARRYLLNCIENAGLGLRGPRD